MNRHPPRLAAWLAACGLLLGGCAVNPATGKRQLSLISESEEIRIGQENDEAITAQMGLYDDESLQQYVQRLGSEMAAKSERPQLDWTFRVVDDPVVNAFALPGGYIYITRGIMAHMNSEAELVSVIGHEIGHVTARHSVSQLSKARLAEGFLTVGAIAAPEYAEQFGGLVETGLGMLFLKYGRDDERQADDLGLRYMVLSGYDPNPMKKLFRTLERVSQAAGGGRVPGWMSTHPAPENRRERIAEQIRELDRDFSDRPRGEAEYFTKIDDLVFGENPREGYFKKNLFLHPEMRFRMEFPKGWKRQNQRQAVVAISDEEDAIVQLTLASEQTAEAALRSFLSQEGIKRSGSSMQPIHGLTTAGSGFTVTRETQKIRGRVGFVEYRDLVFQLLGFSTRERWPDHESAIRRSLASFDELTDRRFLDVQPKRLKLVRPTRATTLEGLAEEHEATVPVETLALINRVDPAKQLRPGRTYKVVVGGELP